MANPLQVIITESKAELTKLLSHQKSNVSRKKIDLLLVLLKYPEGLNKIELSQPHYQCLKIN